MKTVKVKIVTEVTTWVEIDDDENVQDRFVDIYVHGRGEDGHICKEDHGAEKWTIIELDK